MKIKTTVQVLAISLSVHLALCRKLLITLRVPAAEYNIWPPVISNVIPSKFGQSNATPPTSISLDKDKL